MFLETIDQKPFFQKKDGNIIRDLTKSMFDFQANNYTSFNVFKISVDYLMRPDLISQAVYNNTLYTEFILKYNGISNPLTIEEGDLILVPNLESAKKNTRAGKGLAVEDDDPAKRLRDSYKYIDPTKIPKRDKDLAKFADRNLKKKTTIQDGALPPNIADEGTSQIIERNGRIYFGEGIGESACLKNGMSSSEFITKIIKSRKV